MAKNTFVAEVTFKFSDLLNDNFEIFPEGHIFT